MKDLPQNGPLISAIVIAFNRPKMLENSLQSLISQSYKDLEVVLVLNGATTEVRQVAEMLGPKIRNFTVVSFPINVFSIENLPIVFRYVYRAGFDASSGEYVFFQSDDDFVADDFFARMAKLFIDNQSCTTAIGMPHSYYWAEDEVVPPDPGPWEQRATYMDGPTAAYSSMSVSGFTQNPGFSYVMRRDAIMKAKDFWGGWELTQLAQVVPFGVAGFDRKAIMYWGRGEHQGNVQVNRFRARDHLRIRLQEFQMEKNSRLSAEEMWVDGLGKATTKKLTRVMRLNEDIRKHRLLIKSFFAGEIYFFVKNFWRCSPGIRIIPHYVRDSSRLIRALLARLSRLHSA